MSVRAQRAVAAFLVALAGALAYAPALEGDFLNLDDLQYVVNNPLIPGGLTPRSLRWALTAGAFESSEHVDYWQPATLLSRLADGALFGLNPAGHHLTSVLIHLANAVLLLLLLESATGRLWRSATAAAVFATHPLHVSSVAWVAERKDVLSGFFTLLTVAAFARFAATWRGPRGRALALGWYAAVAGGYALCLMSKPMTLPLPLMLLLVAAWPVSPQSRPGLLRVAAALAPLSLLSAGAFYLYTRVPIAASELSQIGARSASSVAGSVVTSLAAYPVRLLYPVNLQHIYAVHPGGAPTWRIAGSVLLLAVPTVAAAAGVRRMPYLAVGWLWYLVALLPAAPLFHSNAAADRFSYVAMIGVTVAIVWSVSDAARGRGRAVRAAAAAAAVAALVFVTRGECRIWRDSRTLFSRLVELDPRHYLAYRNLGVAEAQAGEHEKALRSYEAALAERPDFTSVYFNIALSLEALGRRSEALPYYAEAVRQDPSFTPALHNMGVAHLDAGDFDAALACFMDLLRRNPRDAMALYRVGHVYERMGRVPDAAEFYRRALEVEPKSAFFMGNLGMAVMALGNREEAAELFRRALSVDPADPVAREGLRALGGGEPTGGGGADTGRR